MKTEQEARRIMGRIGKLPRKKKKRIKKFTKTFIDKLKQNGNWQLIDNFYFYYPPLLVDLENQPAGRKFKLNFAK